MKNLSLFMFSFLLGLFAFSQAAAQKDNFADQLLGNWQPSDGRSVVSIYKGDPANGEDPAKYYGKVIWLKEPNDENGTPRKDINNPDASLRDRPLKGLVILKDLEWVGTAKEPAWENGNIYDPKNGSTYSFYVTMKPNNTNTLEGRGYIGVALFGRTDTWVRLVKKN